MFQRLVTIGRAVASILVLAAIALAGQAAQRWH
jgi:hypothetical protein